MSLNPKAAFVGAIGGVFVYSGISGISVLKGIQNVIQGQPFDAGQSVTSLLADNTGNSSSGNGSDGSVAGGTGKANLKATAATFGWTEANGQWPALVSLEMGEAGFNPKNENPNSKAYGEAQSLGHPFTGGPAADGINEYGGEGLTPEQSRQASMGVAAPQALWMCRYIKATYGDPKTAYAKWLSRDPHWY